MKITWADFKRLHVSFKILLLIEKMLDALRKVFKWNGKNTF